VQFCRTDLFYSKRVKDVKIFVAEAHRDDGKRIVVRADEKLTAFIERESAIRD